MLSRSEMVTVFSQNETSRGVEGKCDMIQGAYACQEAIIEGF